MSDRLVLRVRTPEEAAVAASEAAAVCRDPWRVRMALLELLANGIEHGNLGIHTEEKARLLGQGAWEAELARRLALPENAARSVRLMRERRDGAWCFEIEDDGAGFDWRPHLVPDPAGAAAPNGRGILLARQLAFPDLCYLGSGNRLRCSVPLA